MGAIALAGHTSFATWQRRADDGIEGFVKGRCSRYVVECEPWPFESRRP